MKAEVVNTFISSLMSVSEMMFQEKLAIKNTYKKTETTALMEVVVVVGLTGDMRGQVIINFSEETGKAMASRMMGGMPVDTFDDMAKSAVSEVGNIFMGTTSTALSKQGFATDITPPNLIFGSSMTMLGKGQTIVVVMGSAIGDIALEITIDEK